MPELEAAIRDLISRYVAGLIDAGQLNDALPDGWDLDEANEPAAMDLIMDVVAHLSAYQDGDYSEKDLRAALDPLVSWRIERLRMGPGITDRRPGEVVRAAADRPLRAVFGS